MTLWSGRFADEPDALMWAFTVDHSDRRMLPDDVRGSIAHVTMLGHQDIISSEEAASLVDGLRSIEAEANAGAFEFTDSDEDVHSAVERRLIELVGHVGKKLHTGRSRNDQVALDIRLYLARSGRKQITRIAQFASVLVDQAESLSGVIVPSYTHLQQAQAVPFAHHLLAYTEMLRRDAQRISEAVGRLEVSPLGASASGGSSLPLDPAGTAQALGWQWHFINSMDAVAARDVVAEYAFATAQTMVHLSRLSEEIILWSSSEFGWMTLHDSFATGSSAMPQKKNPDIAELVRGRAATAIGDVTTLLGLQKGLPLTYNRDFQEDKRAVFHADDVLAGALGALGGLIATASFHPPEPSADVTALDLAESLTSRAVPFREAHEAVGRLIAHLGADGRSLAQATEADLTAADERFVADDLARIDVADSVQRRITPGGGSFAEVARQIAAARANISQILGD